jgi:uncharacterized protein
MSAVEHIAGRTFHGRRGGPDNRFAYGVDYMLIEPEVQQPAPRLFSRNRRGLIALHDTDHGVQGRGPGSIRAVLTEAGAPEGGSLLLLAQPRILGHVFNPVSFWLYHHDNSLIAVLAEVNNTYGDRHLYLCQHGDFAPITPEDTLQAHKIFHVSPFQPVAGDYRFRFDIGADAVNIRIEYTHPGGSLIATLTGPRRVATARGLLAALVRRPLGSRRVLALIHWQALKLWWRGAPFRARPEPPASEVSR